MGPDDATSSDCATAWEADLRKIFDLLSDGGMVKADLEKMFWGDIFGAVIDRFGIGWQVNIAAD